MSILGQSFLFNSIKMFRLILFSVVVAVAHSHGALYDPPGRSSMWRFGFDNPVNYNDIELFCGGIQRLWQKNKGKCGICGDPWDLPEPRPNEDGGKYGNGIIVRTYKAGQEITSKVYIDANHRGYFEFKLCPVKKGVKVDQDCLDKHPIPLADGSGYKYHLTHGRRHIEIDVRLRLPAGLRCERCVFQWHYKTANNWGKCEDGKGRMGCGPQEYFRGCADVKIV